ncbi:MAG: DUF262 domain-containing protein, partial [Clostridia bacterium]|nr:DUF262 domain-containing protein [Clostridia bacterium]
MANENKEINSIAELFKQRKISIPVIQRDYAQGRNEKSAESIREDFINSLFDAVNDDKEMDINYIYGISKSGGNFLPIDGQQRITSIFLFLWFCAVQEEKTELFCKYVKKFSYMVRISAEEFFDILQDRSDGENPVLKYKDDFKEYADRTVVGHQVVEQKTGKTEPVIRSLKDFNWYKLEWNNDMTIDGAIRFLDCVREKYYNKKYNEKDPDKSFTEKLLGEDSPIKLIFIEQNNTSDKKGSSEAESLDFEAENRAAITYINMNERGKLLNDFENLKAFMCKLDTAEKNAQNFLKEYDSNYINTFMELGNNKDSLSYQVKTADEMAFNFLFHIYCDLKGIENKKWTVYEFIDVLNAEQEKTEIKIFPDDYFEFMSSVIKTLQENKNDTAKQLMKDYCNYYNKPNRYRFYLFFWAVYRGLANDIDWEKLKEHLKLSEDIYASLDNKGFQYIKNLIDILSHDISKDGNSLLNCLAEMDLNHIDSNIIVPIKLNNGLTYGDKTAWKEEKIKSLCCLKDNKDLPDKMELIGKKFNHQIRFLLYMAGLWDGDITQDGLENLHKYISIAEKSDFNTFEWKKIFYLSSLNGSSPSSLPKKEAATTWTDSFLYWSDEDNFNKELIDRIKWCFDKIYETSSENNPDYEMALKKYVKSEKNKLDKTKNVWLYYVLDRNYDELFHNTVQSENGVYIISVNYGRNKQNFYEFVMQKDLKTVEQLEQLSDSIMSKKYKISLGRIENKDNYSNAKNGTIMIVLKNSLIDSSFRYFKDDETLYQYKYQECQKNGSDCKEDCFELNRNSTIIKTFDSECENCCKSIVS